MSRLGYVAPMTEPDPMDTEKVLEQLNVGLELQLRSLLQFTQASSSTGVRTQPLRSTT